MEGEYYHVQMGQSELCTWFVSGGELAKVAAVAPVSTGSNFSSAASTVHHFKLFLCLDHPNFSFLKFSLKFFFNFGGSCRLRYGTPSSSLAADGACLFFQSIFRPALIILDLNFKIFVDWYEIAVRLVPKQILNWRKIYHSRLSSKYSKWLKSFGFTCTTLVAAVGWTFCEPCTNLQ